MAYHNLQNGPVTLTVAAIATVTSEKFNTLQFMLTDTNGDTLYVGRDAALKQFARLGLTEETIVGETVRVERVEKNGTKFTNFYRATPGSVSAPAAAGSASADAAPAAPARAAVAPMDLATAAALYSQCVDKAIATLAVQCEAAGIAFDASAIQAAAATLFIRVSK
jgi:hypothetical protein